ncbi:MAG: PIG-L family deacetylase [Pirellulales bacterium]
MLNSIFRCLLLFGIIGHLLPSPVSAQWDRSTPLDRGAAGVYQSLLQLRTTARVLHVVAHPDDEDGAMLTYCARGLGATTWLFSVTRGEGGANLISRDAFDELGVLRMLEHAESAKYYNVRVRYSSAADYGYSKRLDEAFDQWQGQDRVLGELVDVIRTFRPDVIVSRFRGDQRDGHGHHQFAGVLSRRAMEVSGDAGQFADQAAQPWQPQKLYTNNIQPQWRAEDKEAWTVAVPTGKYDAILGMSYAQIARFGLGYQRSQGFSGHDGPAGEAVSYYRLADGKEGTTDKVREDSFLDGLDTTIGGLARYAGESPPAWLTNGLLELQRNVDRAWQELNLHDPESTVPDLAEANRKVVELLKQLSEHDSVPNKGVIEDRLREKHAQLQEAIRRATGIEFELRGVPASEADDSRGSGERQQVRNVSRGDKLKVDVSVVNRSELPVQLLSGWLETGMSPNDRVALPIQAESLPYNKVWNASTELEIAQDVPYTRPTWIRETIQEPYYQRGGESGAWEAEEGLRGGVRLAVGGSEVDIWCPIRARWRHPDYGDLSQPVAVVPRLSVSFDSPVTILVEGQNEHAVAVKVRNAIDLASSGTLQLELPAGWTSEPSEATFSLDRIDEEMTARFVVRVPAARAERTVQIGAVARSDMVEYREGYSVVTARDLGRAHVFRPAEQRLTLVDVKVPAGLKVGYVMGAGDDIPVALNQLGVQTTLLGPEDLAQGDLSHFNAIMIGIRAYAVRSDLIAANSRLLDYVHRGGNLVVNYQTPEFDRNLGPYPYVMGRNPEEVSEQDATVTILEPDHVLFAVPNRLTPADFEGWFEQRGSKFWQSWDARYQPLLECHDREQAPQRGGLLLARYGDGVYVYSAYALYRQLPQGVPGAYRLLANLVAAGSSTSPNDASRNHGDK